MEYIFGPIHSHRLGLSLGIDILGKKICSFNCIYCEISKTEILTTKIQNYVDKEEIFKELDFFFKKYPNVNLNWISFSGKGEPTLHQEIDKMIARLKTLYQFPIAIFTNSAHLNSFEVRKKLLQADLILPSLNAISKKIYKKINLHHSDIQVENVIKGIFALKQEYKGLIYLEILFVKGVNDSEEEIELLEDFTYQLQPNAVYINTIYRPPAFKRFEGLSQERLKGIQERFEKLLINKNIFKSKAQENIISNQKIISKKMNNFEKQKLLNIIQNLLNVRPSTEKNIQFVLKSYDYSWSTEAWNNYFAELITNKYFIIKKEYKYFMDKENLVAYYQWNSKREKDKI